MTDPPSSSEPAPKPVSRFATRALLFALIPLGANILIGIVNKLFEAASMTDADVAYGVASLGYLVLYVLSRGIVVALVVVSLIAGRGALRQIGTREFRGLPRTIFAIVLDLYLLVFVVLGLIALIGALLAGAA